MNKRRLKKTFFIFITGIILALLFSVLWHSVSEVKSSNKEQQRMEKNLETLKMKADSGDFQAMYTYLFQNELYDSIYKVYWDLYFGWYATDRISSLKGRIDNKQTLWDNQLSFVLSDCAYFLSLMDKDKEKEKDYNDVLISFKEDIVFFLEEQLNMTQEEIDGLVNDNQESEDYFNNLEIELLERNGW